MSPRGPLSVSLGKMAAGAHGWKGAQPTPRRFAARDIRPENIAPPEEIFLPCDCAPYSASLGPFTVGGGFSDLEQINDLCATEWVCTLTFNENWPNFYTQAARLSVRFNPFTSPTNFNWVAYVYGDGGADTTVTRGLGRDSEFSPLAGPTETSGLAKPMAGDTMELHISDALGTASLAMVYNGVTMFTGTDTGTDTEIESADAFLFFEGDIGGGFGITISQWTVDASC